MFADFAGERWIGYQWPHGPDLFSNQILGYPLMLGQFVACVMLLVAGIKKAQSHPGMVGVVFGVLLVANTAAVCFVTYCLFALYYLLDIMGRSL